jgi:hypothetical protein
MDADNILCSIQKYMSSVLFTSNYVTFGLMFYFGGSLSACTVRKAHPSTQQGLH